MDLIVNNFNSPNKKTYHMISNTKRRNTSPSPKSIKIKYKNEMMREIESLVKKEYSIENDLNEISYKSYSKQNNEKLRIKEKISYMERYLNRSLYSKNKEKKHYNNGIMNCYSKIEHLKISIF